jgi:TatD DNase family protein
MEVDKFITFKYYDFHSHSKLTEKDIFRINSQDVHDLDLHDDSYYSIGIHPWYIDNSRIDTSIKILESNIKLRNCIAIGEAGLDRIKGPEIEIQKRVFQSQIDFACHYRLPLVIHCVKSFDILFNIFSSQSPNIFCIIHGFNKSVELARSLIKKGFLLSFGDSVLKSLQLQNLVQSLNPDSFFLETDDSSCSIGEIYEFVAKLKCISIEDLAQGQRKLYLAIFQKLFFGN